MKKMIRPTLRTAAVLIAVMLLAACEFLFYSPAFIPAVSETELQLIVGNYTEQFNGEEVGYGTYNFADPTLNYASPFGSNGRVPAMDALRIGGDDWHGISEFLGIFFQSGPNINGGGLQAGLNGNFRSYTVTFDLNTTLVSSYELPFAAVKGIGDDEKYLSKLTGNLSRVDVDVTSAGHENLRGDGTFIFGNGPGLYYGLLYMVFYHESGLVTVAYQRTINSPGGIFFPDGSFNYVINVFKR